VDLRLVLSIASFSLSVGGLVSVRRERRKRLALGLICALVVTSGATLFQEVSHRSAVVRAQAQLDEQLADGTWTLEDIFAKLPSTDTRVIEEALRRSVAEGSLRDQRVEFRLADGSYHSVRGFARR
jgi:hypothetical protein